MCLLSVSYKEHNFKGEKLHKLSSKIFNPSNAKATFIQSTRMQRFFENHLNPVMLVFIG